MKIRMMRLLLVCLSLLFVSCGGNDVTPPAIVTGWVIGQTTDEDTGVPTAKVLKTVNGGLSWTLQSLPAECEGMTGNDISAAGHQVAWAALGQSAVGTTAGGILRTADGGSTWGGQTLPNGMISRHIKGIKAVTADEAWAVSLQGDVLHTTDAGVTWRLVPVHTAAGDVIAMSQVNRMDVTGPDIWIVDVSAGNQGVIHSPDGGLTWWRETLPDISGTGHGPLVISAFSSLVAWAAVNSEGNLWWTTNGGRSWNKSTDSLTGTADYDDINASSADIIWIACNGGGWNGGFTARVKVTGGEFASNTTQHYPYMMEGVSPMSDDTAWAVGFRMSSVQPGLPKGAIFFTRDGGINWQLQQLPANALDVEFWKVSFAGARR